MTKETRESLLIGALECLEGCDELFVYVLLPLLCVAVLYVIGISVYHVVFDPNAVDVASTLDCLSIDPAKWFPRS